MADRAFLEDETLFGMGWTVPWDGNSQAASAQGDALAQQVEALSKLVDDLKLQLNCRDEAMLQLQRSQEAANLLATELQRCLQAKYELQQARGKLEQENHLLWVERYVIGQLLGVPSESMNENAIDSSLCGALAAQVDAARQGKAAELHLHCVAEQLRQLVSAPESQQSRTPGKQGVSSSGTKPVKRSSSTLGLTSLPSSPAPEQGSFLTRHRLSSSSSTHTYTTPHTTRTSCHQAHTPDTAQDHDTFSTLWMDTPAAVCEHTEPGARPDQGRVSGCGPMSKEGSAKSLHRDYDPAAGLDWASSVSPVATTDGNTWDLVSTATESQPSVDHVTADFASTALQPLAAASAGVAVGKVVISETRLDSCTSVETAPVSQPPLVWGPYEETDEGPTTPVRC